MGQHHVLRGALDYLRISYPIVLLVVFAAAFVANSILTARTASRNPPAARASQTGPGGRPLPQRSRSTVAVVKAPQKFSRNANAGFVWLSCGILVTLVAEAAINVAHVMVARSQQWWCGQAVVVCTEHSFVSR